MRLFTLSDLKIIEFLGKPLFGVSFVLFSFGDATLSHLEVVSAPLCIIRKARSLTEALFAPSPEFSAAVRSHKVN